jgi:DNA gyrase subunit B
VLLASGEERAGADLRRLVEDARQIRNILSGLHSRYNRKVIAQAALLGVLNADIVGDARKASAAVPYIVARLDALAEETERGWQGEFGEDTGFTFSRTVRGVGSRRSTRPARSADARKLDEFAPSLQLAYPRPTPPAMLRRKTRPSDSRTCQPVPGAHRRRPQGLTLQRHGSRRNESRARETTLDVNALAAAGAYQGSRRSQCAFRPVNG